MLKGHGGKSSKQHAIRRSSAVIRAKPLTSQKQTFLAVARYCRDCGERLEAIEGALHQCRKSLHWPFGSTAVDGWKTTEKIGSSFRIARLGSGDLAGLRASARFDELWTFISNDLSHSLGAPSPASLGNRNDTLLICLRGREVMAMLWGELLSEGTSIREAAMEGQHSQKRLIVGRRGLLGVRLIWVHKSCRKKGLATSLVDSLRMHAGGLGGKPIPADEVAFSEPTEQGLAFANRYAYSKSVGDSALIYTPT
jgi:hypothetical protein|mmetsp:Transcript_56123/g.88994  ORF Transcript_56123/g.88994 Transcript_56123/m.88994 type:complete len:253 (-) Transcript_56123:162-920(-)